MDIDNLKSKLLKYGQSHLIQFWNELTEEQKGLLYEDISKLDLEELLDIYKEAEADLQHAPTKLDDLMSPIPDHIFGAVNRTTPEALQEYLQKGLNEIKESRVAVVLLAGGQGTRLGVPYPKGMYDVGLPSHKSLFQIQAERMKRLQDICGKGHISWYIMTSKATAGPTADFFEKNKYFGLEKEHCHMFEQEMLPCFSFDGKLILDSPWALARAPDGNGSLYKALRKTGMLTHMIQSGIQHVHAYCVDNILVRVADPVFIGYCMTMGADCGAKAVEKTVPNEAVGVVCEVNGKYQVVEYSEITSATAEKTDTSGRLAFRAGNICNHYFTVDFLNKVCNLDNKSLKYHVAKKKIPHINSQGVKVKPTTPNGIKFEKFVFDVFSFSKRFVVWGVMREDEFSPLKNADTDSSDTPTTARNAIYNLHARYVMSAGGRFVDQDRRVMELSSVKTDELVVEVSPLISYGGENLEKHVQGKDLLSPTHLF